MFGTCRVMMNRFISVCILCMRSDICYSFSTAFHRQHEPGSNRSKHAQMVGCCLTDRAGKTPGLIVVLSKKQSTPIGNCGFARQENPMKVLTKLWKQLCSSTHSASFAFFQVLLFRRKLVYLFEACRFHLEDADIYLAIYLFVNSKMCVSEGIPFKPNFFPEL